MESAGLRPRTRAWRVVPVLTGNSLHGLSVRWLSTAGPLAHRGEESFAVRLAAAKCWVMDTDLPEVLTAAEAAAGGISRHALAHRVARGRWQRPYPRVYVTHSGALSREATLRAALAYAGEGSALSHDTAAEWQGVRGPRTKAGKPREEVVHITVPADRRVMPQPGLALHHSRRLGDCHVRSVRGLPCTTVERTVFDLVAKATSPGRAACVLLDAVASRRTTARRLRSAAAKSPPHRYGQVVVDVLAEAAEGAHSLLELSHTRVCRTHGLPVGERQRRQKVDGKVTYIDNIIEGFGIVTELDGHHGHDRADDRFRDNWRDNVNVLLGRAPLRHGWRDMLDRPCEVARQRAIALRNRGWHGPIIACGPGCMAAQPFEP